MAEQQSIDIRVKLGDFVLVFDRTEGSMLASPEHYSYRHNHAAYEIHYIGRGRCSVRIGSSTEEISEGEFFIIPPKEYHTMRADPGQPMERESFFFSFYEEPDGWQYPPRRECRELLDAFSGIIGYALVQDDFGGGEVLRLIRRELLDRRHGWYAKLQSLYASLLTELSRRLMPEEEGAPLPVKTLDEQRREIIERFFDMDYDCDAQRTEGELAERLCVSRRQLTRILRSTFNMTFREKLLRSRIEAAADLLENTELPVKEIARRLGYGSETNFYSAFRRVMGNTPMAARKRHREKTL